MTDQHAEYVAVPRAQLELILGTLTAFQQMDGWDLRLIDGEAT